MATHPPPPTCLLAVFDFDGTLADTMPWFFGVLNQLAESHRFRKIDTEEAERLRHLSSREVMRSLGISRWRLPFIAREMGRLNAEAAATGCFHLFPGVAELLADLAARGILIAIISSNRESTIRHILGPSAVHVTHYACSAALFGKARRFRQLMRLTGLPSRSILSIGDEVRDIEAARSLSIPTVAVTWGYAHEAALRVAGADMIVHSVDELRHVVFGNTECKFAG